MYPVEHRIDHHACRAASRGIRGQAGGVQWLWFSLVASVVLTVLLNVAIRLWPGGAERSARRLDDWAQQQAPPPPDGRSGGGDGPQVRVIVPWKAMLLASVVLTVVLNVVLRLA
jgi:hypothetical protein